LILYALCPAAPCGGSIRILVYQAYSGDWAKVLVDSARKPGAPGEKREGDMLNCHPQLIAIVTDRASQGWPTITSRNCGAGMTGIERRAVRRFWRGQCPETPRGFYGRRVPKRHRRQKLKARRHSLLDRCYMLTFGLCVHMSTETKAGFKVSLDLNPAFPLCVYLQTHRPRNLGKSDTVSPFWGHLLAAVELRGSHSPYGIRG